MEKNKAVFIVLGVALIAFVAGLFIGKGTVRKEEEKKETDTSAIVAKVGTRKITADQFRNEMVRRGGSNPEKLDKKQLLEELIDSEIIIGKAIEAGIDKDPEVIRSANNMLIGKYKQRNLESKIQAAAVTEQDIKAEYDANISSYTQPAKARLAIIFMETNPTMSAEKLSEIQAHMAEVREKAIKAAQEPSGFGPLAAEYSQDQASRYRGGDIGWLDEGRPAYRWDNKIVSAGFALKNNGDVSEAITTDKGLYLVKLIEKRESSVTPLQQAEPRIRHKLLMEKRKDAEKVFKQELRTATAVEIFNNVLDSVQAPPPPAPPAVPGKPSQPQVPAVPGKQPEPAKPAVPAKPGEPGKPAEHPKPVIPSESVKPGEPPKPAPIMPPVSGKPADMPKPAGQPAMPPKLPVSSDPAGAVKPAENMKVSAPEKPADSQKPAEAQKTGGDVKPADSPAKQPANEQTPSKPASN